MREDMTKLWSTEELLGWDEREILVWYHSMNYCSFKYLLIISRRRIIPSKLNKIRKIPPCVTHFFGKPP